METNEIIDLYVNKKLSCKSIAKQLNSNVHRVFKILKDSGIKVRGNITNKVKYTCNDTIFHNLNKNSAYWLGFLFADGNISTYRDKICLALSEKDIDHLEKFKLFMNYTGNIRSYERQSGFSSNYRVSKVEITSSIACNKLMELGCVRNKTFSLTPPNIDINLIPHFIRGYFDGDGCITSFVRYYKTKKGIAECKNLSANIKITGTKEILNFILEKLPISGKQKLWQQPINKGKNIYHITIGGNGNISKIKNYFYDYDNITFLTRKYLKFNLERRSETIITTLNKDEGIVRS